MFEKFKSWLLNDQLFYSSIILLVGIGSFFLGQASVSSPEPTPNKIEQNKAFLPPVLPVATTAGPEVSPTSQTANVQAGTVVASKSGTKYHLPTCAGAKQIKEQNKISFASAAEAEAAGYKPAANCPGLQ